jgi:hypothetical protein
MRSVGRIAVPLNEYFTITLKAVSLFLKIRQQCTFSIFQIGPPFIGVTSMTPTATRPRKNHFDLARRVLEATSTVQRKF